MRGKNRNGRIITDALLEEYRTWLYACERSTGTIKTYFRYLRLFQIYLDGEKVSKNKVIAWKEELKTYLCANTVNVALAAVNGFFKFYCWNECTVKFIRTNRKVFWQEQQVLSVEEYKLLVRTAQRLGQEQLALLMQTVCCTGIRISELRYITVEAAEKGSIEVECKGRVRTIFLTRNICRMLCSYASSHDIRSGMIFITKNGKQLDRSNIWRSMQRVGAHAGVDREKIYPHNLRHLFARSYYNQEKDLSRLADILGHSSVNTTRIYTIESGWNHLQQMERLDLTV